MIALLIAGLLLFITPFVPAIILLTVALFIRKRTKHKYLPMALAIIGILLIWGYGAEQWLNPRLESAQAIDLYDGSLLVVKNSDFRLSDFDVDPNLTWEKGALISLIYQTNILGYKQDIQIDQMNPPQQASDLKYDVGSSEGTYNDCAEDSGPVACQNIGSVQGNPVFFTPTFDSETTTFAYAKINNNIIAIADHGSIQGKSTNLTPSEAKIIFNSLKLMTKNWEINTLVLHYNGGVFVLGRPGNSIIPLPA